MFGQRIRETRDEGFTLIELLIVIVVLGILAGIVVFGVATFRSDANDSACNTDRHTIAVAASAYLARNGSAPANVAVLVNGGYLKATPTAVNPATVTFDANANVTAATCVSQ